MINLPSKTYDKPGTYVISINNISNFPQLNVDSTVFSIGKQQPMSYLVYDKDEAFDYKNKISFSNFIAKSSAKLYINDDNVDINGKHSLVENLSFNENDKAIVKFNDFDSIKVNDYLGKNGNSIIDYKYYIQGNLSLSRAIINVDTLSNIDDYCFFCCNNLKELEFYTLKQTNYTQYKIGNYCFANCTKLGAEKAHFNVTLYFPEGLTSIGEYAFYNCINLVSIKLPSTIRSIGKGAFGNCKNLKYVIFDNKNKNEILSIENYGTWFNTNDKVLIIPGIVDDKINKYKNFQEKYTFKYENLMLENILN